jgi:lipopolysaccharide export system ATP-binding protein
VSGEGLRAEGLTKRYGDRDVVLDVSLELAQGCIVGLLGPNGAGKTTTFYMLVGIVKPNSGEVYLDGEPVAHWPLHERARRGMSYLPQESSVFKKLSVWQNLEIILEYTDLNRKERKRRASELLDELGILRLADQKALHLSGGERRRLEIARALIRKPKYILLDEPFAGIDPLAVDDIQAIINSLKEKNIGVLISDHNVRETLTICDRAYLVFEGRIILEGTSEEIVADPRARRLYLGEGFSL